MLRVLAIVSLVCAASARQIPFSSGRIVYGESISIEQAPHQVSLIRTSNDRHTCGGSIVSPHFVLTAGHCAGGKASAYKIRSGSTYWAEGGTVHEVVKVIRHEKYGGNAFGSPVNDIALMRVKQPFVLGETRKLVKLFEKNKEAQGGAVAVVTGWGKTENGTVSDQLRSLTINIVDKATCNAAYEDRGGLPENEICAQYETGLKDMCNGDSGGPLMVNGRQAGIVSWSGPGCALPEFPGVYTEVAQYRDWIAKHIKGDLN